MRKSMKHIGLLLAAFLMTASVAACSNNNNSSSSSATNVPPASNISQSTDAPVDPLAAPYELTMAMPVFGAIPADLELVEAEINKYTQEKINTTIDILPISIGNYGQQMNLMTSSGEKLDLMFEFGISSMYSNDALTGKLVALDELLAEYGEDTVAAIGADYMESARVAGSIYGIPTMHSYASQPAIFMRKDIIDKHNIDVSSIHSLQDLEPIFQVIKEKEPGMAGIANGLSRTMDFYRSYDKLGDGIGVLPNFDNDMQIVNLYETEEYAALLQLMREWFVAGYVNKDAATTQTTSSDMLKADKAFSYITMNKPEIKAQEERLIGKELVVVNLDIDAYAVTTDVITGLWGIAQQSENPERAMMFLNMMYTDPQLANLIIWGIEDKHYVKVSDNVIRYPDGIDSSTVGYAINALTTSNPFIAYTLEGTDPKLADSVLAWNESAKKSKALGFTFNPSNVQNEITAIGNVNNRYRGILETGSVEPDSKLKEYISQLQGAGIDKVIAEKQKQLDEWVASKQ